jgi:membrane-associated phospholipid phosphatase
MKQQAITIKLKLIDWATLAFCVWMLLLVSFGWERVHNPLVHFISYLTIITAVLMLIWFTEFMKGGSRLVFYKVLAFVRSFYPVLLFLYFFESTSATNKVLFHNWLDPFFLNIDKRIFGYLPSMQWAIRYDNPWLREWLYFSYFSYYLMIMGLPLLFYLKRRKAMDEMVYVLSSVFYFCYFIYSWLPVIGGRYIPEAMELTRQSAGGVFTSAMAFIYTHSPHLGGAFPSSHIAIALVLSLLAWEHFTKLGYLLLFITFFLAVATVYCHYHWFIDAVFGVITGLAGFLAARYLFRKLSEEKIER